MMVKDESYSAPRKPPVHKKLIAPIKRLQNQQKPELFMEDDKSADWESKAGKFGWDYVDKFLIPYIYRGGQKYCSATMVSLKLLKKFEHTLNTEVHSCFKVMSYQMTESEAKLFNEINNFHCEGFMGLHHFKTTDIMLLLKDVVELFNFMQICYNILIKDHTKCNGDSRVGFVRIGENSLVPYVLEEGSSYVPLFYFEGESEYLCNKAVNITGWSLSYLKFCFKMQGIRPDLYEGESCRAVKICEVQKYFPPNTRFMFDWPKNDVKKFLKSHSGKSDSAKTSDHANKLRKDKHVEILAKSNKVTYLVQPHGTKPKTSYPSFHNTNPGNPILQQVAHQLMSKAVPCEERPNDKTYKTMLLPFLGKEVRCINLRPSVFTTLMISLYELYSLYFYKSNKDQFLLAISAVQIRVYEPNKYQLMELFQTQSRSGDVSCLLVLVKDVAECIEPLKKLLNVTF